MPPGCLGFLADPVGVAKKGVGVTGTASMPPGTTGRDRFVQARHELHSVVQWLARMAFSYRDHEPSDGNLALLWDGKRRAISTQRLVGDLAVEVGLPDLVLQFTEAGLPVPHAFETEEHSPAHVEAWILVELLHRNMDRDRFSKLLPYDVTTLMTGDAIMFSPGTHTTELANLAAWFSYATSVLEDFASQVDARAAPAGLRIYPQDLCLEMQVPLAAARSGARQFIRTGFSLGNQQSPEPNFRNLISM